MLQKVIEFEFFRIKTQKISLTSPMVQNVTEFDFFQNKKPKLSLISPKLVFGDIREIFKFLF